MAGIWLRKLQVREFMGLGLGQIITNQLDKKVEMLKHPHLFVMRNIDL
jgi:hypothetical protein